MLTKYLEPPGSGVSLKQPQPCPALSCDKVTALSPARNPFEFGFTDQKGVAVRSALTASAPALRSPRNCIGVKDRTDIAGPLLVVRDESFTATPIWLMLSSRLTAVRAPA